MSSRLITLSIARRSAGLSNGLRVVLIHRPWIPRFAGNHNLWFAGSLSWYTAFTFGTKTKLHSEAPLASAVVCALLSLYEVYRSSLTFGRSCQYESRTSRVVVCGVNDFSLYGPVPIGFFTVSWLGSLKVDHCAFGTTKTVRTLFWFVNWDLVKVRSTLLPL